MNKEQLIARNPGVKLYDLSEPSDMHRMNMNERYCIKTKKEPSFKLIAPFGHPLKYKADFYYFESENTPISEQILEEMGFGFNYTLLELQINRFLLNYHNGSIYLDDKRLKFINANQLHQLIELLK